MGYKIVWTKEALELYLQIIRYLSLSFSEKEVISSPRLKNVYRTVISRRVELIYRFRPIKKEIELLQFWDTRRNPRNAKF